MTAAAAVPPPPALRGHVHAAALPAVLAAGIVLVALAPTAGARVASALYLAAGCALFGASAAYHLLRRPGRAGRVLRRLDHSGIYLVIAGTYTPFAVLALGGAARAAVLAVVWGGALAGIALRFLWEGSPRWVEVPLFMVLGWTAAFVVPDLLSGAGVAAFVLVAAGGGVYSLGAVVFATRWPNPAPRVLGFHEVFHLLTVAAFVTQYVGVSLVVYGA